MCLHPAATRKQGVKTYLRVCGLDSNNPDCELQHRPMARAVLVSRAAATPTWDRCRRLPTYLAVVHLAARRRSRWVLWQLRAAWCERTKRKA
jgi:hypothetical protein